MTISTTTTRQKFLGNGAQSVFAYTFLLPAVGQYSLYYTDTSDNITLISQSAYSVSGVANPAGGNVTYLPGGTPIASGTSITLVRNTPYIQTTELGNQGAYYPGVIESALDSLSMQIQQLKTLADLSFKAPLTNPVVADVPTVENRASKYAAFDGLGNLVALETGAVPSPTSAGSLEITGAQDINALPTGNPVATLSSLTVTGSTASQTTREFLVSIGLLSNKGAAAASPERDKVALYAGVIADSGTGDVWSLNTVMSLFPGASAYSAQGYELDFNNLNGHRGDTPGAAGLAAPIAYGLSITGVAAYHSTSAFLIAGASSDVWNRGITITSGVIQSSIQDVSTAARAVDLQGSYTHAIDVSASVSSVSTIQMGTQHYLYGKTAAAVPTRMLGMDGTDQILLGDPTANVAIYAPSLIPASDGTVPLGASGRRWSEVFAATGVINTSDPSAKRNMSPLSGATAMLRDVQPISFQFLVGGATPEKVLVTRERQVHEAVEGERDEVVIEGDRAVLRKRRVVEQRGVVDVLPVVDASGQPVLDWAKPVRGKDGRELHPGQWVPRRHTRPRMETVEVEETRLVPRDGKRVHLGFSATDVHHAVAKLGLGDMGVYVKSADGLEGLRTDQLIAVLWQAVREMDVRLQDVEDL